MLNEKSLAVGRGRTEQAELVLKYIAMPAGARPGGPGRG